MDLLPPRRVSLCISCWKVTILGCLEGNLFGTFFSRSWKQQFTLRLQALWGSKVGSFCVFFALVGSDPTTTFSLEHHYFWLLPLKDKMSRRLRTTPRRDSKGRGSSGLCGNIGSSDNDYDKSIPQHLRIMVDD